MFTGLIGAVLGVVLAAPFLFRTAKRGDKMLALVYLVITALTGFFVGRMLIIRISDGVI